MRQLSILPLVACLFIAGCDGEVECQEAFSSASIHFSGFDSTSLSEVTMSRFDSHNRRIDSTTYRLSAFPTPLEYYDTVNGFVFWPYKPTVTVGEDWEISVPGAGKTYRISGLELSDGKAKNGGMGEDDRCADVVTGYYLNGAHVSTGLTFSRYGTRAEIWLTR